MSSRIPTIEEELAYLSSVKNMETVKQTAFKELQKNGSFSSVTPDGNEAAIHAGCVRINIGLTNRYHKVSSELLNDVRMLAAQLDQDVAHQLVGSGVEGAEAEISFVAGQPISFQGSAVSTETHSAARRT